MAAKRKLTTGANRDSFVTLRGRKPLGDVDGQCARNAVETNAIDHHDGGRVRIRRRKQGATAQAITETDHQQCLFDSHVAYSTICHGSPSRADAVCAVVEGRYVGAT